MGDDKLNNRLDGLFSSFGDILSSATEADPVAPDAPVARTHLPTIELETITGISDLTATVFDPDDLLQNVAELIQKNFELAQVGIYFLDKEPEEPMLMLTAAAGFSAEQQPARAAIPLRNNPTLIASVARDNIVRMNNDLAADSPLAPARSALVVPMTIVDHVIGVLVVSAGSPNYFSPADERIFTTLAAQIVVASQNIRLLRNSEKQARRLILLNEMATSLNMTATIDQALNVAARYIHRIVHSARTGIALLPPKQSAWANVHTFSGETGVLESQERVPLAGTVIASAVKQQALVNVPFLRKSDYVDCRKLAQDGFLSTMVVPLVLGHQVVGVVMVSSRAVDAYDVGDEEMMLYVAAFLASTIYNRGLFNQIQTAFTEAEILYETSADINTALSYDEILEAVYRYTRLGESPIDVSLYFFDQPKDAENTPYSVLHLAAITEPVDVRMHARLPYETFAALVDDLLPEEPLLIADLPQDPRLNHTLRTFFGNQLGAACLLVVPLVVGKQIVGFIIGSYAEPISLSEAEERRLMSLAGQAAVAAQNRYTLHLSEQQTRELAAVNRVLREVSRQLELEQVLETVYREIQRVIPVEAFYVALYNASSEMLTFPLVYDDGEQREFSAIPVSEHPDIARVIASGEPLFITRTPDEVADIALRRAASGGGKGEPAATLLFVPLLLGKQLIGVMSVQSYHYDAYSERDAMLMTSMANHLAVAIQNAQLYRQAQVRARREMILRQVTNQIRGAVDVDSVMRVTAEQVSRTLGRRTFIRLRDDGSPQLGGKG